jgi:hypothetical protein
MIASPVRVKLLGLDKLVSIKATRLLFADFHTAILKQNKVIFSFKSTALCLCSETEWPSHRLSTLCPDSNTLHIFSIRNIFL